MHFVRTSSGFRFVIDSRAEPRSSSRRETVPVPRLLAAFPVEALKAPFAVPTSNDATRSAAAPTARNRPSGAARRGVLRRGGVDAAVGVSPSRLSP